MLLKFRILEKAKLPLSVEPLKDYPWSELTTSCTFLILQHAAVMSANALNIPVM
jgi:hypothetical protein